MSAENFYPLMHDPCNPLAFLIVYDLFTDAAMRFPILRHFRSTSRRSQVGEHVRRDADELILLWGAGAFDRATDLSWREDSGLAQSPRPGHWWSVRREVGRRLGRKDVEVTADIAA